MSAPLGIVVLGIWGAQLREQRWPTRPRIVACRMRAATPLEISQGATVGVTVEALVPSPMMKPCPGSLGYSLLDSHQQAPNSTAEGEDHENHNECRGSYYQLEQNHAYNWADSSSSQAVHIAEVSLNSACNAFPAVQ